MRNYKLDTSLLPKVWVTWVSKKNGRFNKRYWLNCQTGKKKTIPEDWMVYENENDINTYHWRGNYNYGCTYKTEKNDNIWIASGSTLRYCYLKYHKDIDRLEIAAVGFDTSRKSEKHQWKFLGNRFFIGRDKSVINQQGKAITECFPADVYQYHTVWNAKNMISMLTRLHTSKSFIDEFKKFIGANDFVIGNGRVIHIESAWHLCKWYETSQKVRGKGKEQKLTDELVKLPLTDISTFEHMLQPKEIAVHNDYIRVASHILYYERINDEWSVLRAFSNYSYDGIVENWRMYINDNGKNRIVSRNVDEWIPSKQIHSGWGSYIYFANTDEAIEKCNRIKYILKGNSIIETQLVDFLITALRFPEIEQMAKMGYAEHTLRITRTNTPKAELKHMFGGYYKEKEKTLLKKVGLTKPQLDYYMLDEQNHWQYQNACRTMRELFGEDLSYMDIESFKKYLEGCRQVNNRCYRGFETCCSNLNFDRIRILKMLVRLAEKRNNVYAMFFDTLYDYQSLNHGTRPEINWYFDDISDLVRAHDAITELKRIQDEERRVIWDMEAAERRKKEEEKRIKMDKERHQYTYEDDEYIIRLPKDLTEIVDEGRIQRICIGGYTSRHAMGQTNIFFLRKKDDEDTPFYAIEMSNDKVIVQIHGSCNQWLGVHPEAIPTVVRWLRKHGIKCDEKILTCAAKGYSATNHYVPMPVVD